MLAVSATTYPPGGSVNTGVWEPLVYTVKNIELTGSYYFFYQFHSHFMEQVNAGNETWSGHMMLTDKIGINYRWDLISRHP